MSIKIIKKGIDSKYIYLNSWIIKSQFSSLCYLNLVLSFFTDLYHGIFGIFILIIFLIFLLINIYLYVSLSHFFPFLKGVHNNTVHFKLSLLFDMDKSIDILSTTNKVKAKKRVSI